MRDDPTARLPAGDDPEETRHDRSAVGTLRIRTVEPDGRDEGHAPGPGLVLPPLDVVRDPVGSASSTAGTCRLPARGTGAAADDASPVGAVPDGEVPTGAAPRDAGRAAAAPVSARPTGAAPSTAVPSTAVPSTAVPSTAAPTGVAPGGTRTTGVAPRNWAAQNVAGRVGAPQDVRPRNAAPRGPGGERTVRVAPSRRPAAVTPSPVAPSAVRPATPVPPVPAPRTARRRRPRASSIVGGAVLGLVAVLAAAWTVVVPPGGPEEPRPVAAPATPATPAVRWVRTGGDEFDGPRLSSSRWRTYDSVGAFGHGLRRSSAVSQGDGLLTITARPRVAGGTSGGMAMSTGQLYGRWEFRARADPGKGYSPAVLLWPDSERFPIDGELDMLEAPVADRSNASAYVHYGADNRTRGAQVNGDFTQWHTFAMEWLPDRITWYVDGRKEWEITDRTVIPTKPMHLCIQLDQGPAPKFMPGPDATTPDQVRMQVDWARQYRVG